MNHFTPRHYQQNRRLRAVCEVDPHVARHRSMRTIALQDRPPSLSGTDRDEYFPYSRSDHGQFPGGWLISSGSQLDASKADSMCFSVSIVDIARTSVPTAISAIFVAFSIRLGWVTRALEHHHYLVHVNFEPALLPVVGHSICAVQSRLVWGAVTMT
ncbi:hypothetical protein BDY19DRAFT_653978 [Irpex rosettiformis]|uniref:Uncharacterized protein n=1 Tax=Irpex rosettiformis TaxID=378272 RepID=A0ACB8TND0_9APHY|nr:hypothetical protein BDY19DRAFT_653978 [Irpex rosettiformis]